MPENDQKERQLGGDTVEAGDQAALTEVRASLLEHVRATKGLPPKPVNLDVKILSQLPNSSIIDNHREGSVPAVTPVDIHKLPAHCSMVGLVKLRERLKKISQRAA